MQIFVLQQKNNYFDPSESHKRGIFIKDLVIYDAIIILPLR